MTSSGSVPLVTYDRDEAGVGHITLRREHKLNAINPAAMRALVTAFDRFHRDAEARVAVLSGAGRSFCAGADVVEVAAASDPDWSSDVRLLPELFVARAAFKPIIVAAHGHVIGAGLRLLLLSDFAVCAESASFRVPEISHGLDGSPYWVLLRQRAGDAFAMDVVGTGRSWTAAEALARGLVTRVVPDAELPGSAQRLATELAAQPADAMAAVIDTRRTALRRAELDAWTTRGRGLGWAKTRSAP
jgi:enoyl-CoA hydratase/carnithine racemase